MSDHYAKSRERFERDTAKHEMTVLHDDGVYRHVRYSAPGTYCYGYDLVTWPGHLVICGDMGDWMFSRLHDMFEFFGGPMSAGPGREINPDYWSEKLRGPGNDTARRYSGEAYRARVREWLADTCEEFDEDDAAVLRAAVGEQLLSREAEQEHDAHEMLRVFECLVACCKVRIEDSWEWDLREYHPWFLWACWAIVRGIEQYRAAAAVSA